MRASLPRDLVEFYSRLKQAGMTRDIFSPAGQKALITSAQFAEFEGDIAGTAQAKDREGILLALRCLAILDSSNSSKQVDVDFVTTAPGFSAKESRRTDLTVPALINGAKDEVIAFGYEISDSDVVKCLYDAGRRGVQLVLICDRGLGSAGNLKSAWPAEAGKPDIYQDVVREGAAIYAKMHSKILLVDSSRLLVTSANLTYHGLKGNLEFGVLLSGDVAVSARRLIRQIINSGILEKITW